MINQSNLNCPCGAGLSYDRCCKPFHQGQLAENALKLMRSRYSAYALGLTDYIISTTHPANYQYTHDVIQWTKEILQFCVTTKFNKLEIHSFEENDSTATVTFTAHLSQNQQDASFTEKSHFEKVNQKWLYLSGQITRN